MFDGESEECPVDYALLDFLCIFDNLSLISLIIC